MSSSALAETLAAGQALLDVELGPPLLGGNPGPVTVGPSDA